MTSKEKEIHNYRDCLTLKAEPFTVTAGVYGNYNESVRLRRKTNQTKKLAARNNEGKAELSYIDLTCFEGAARVLAWGALKYQRDNWRKGFPMSKLLDSMMRHIAALQRGEMIDPESGLPHAGHIQANAMFLGLANNIDDLYKPQ